jgi:hypothetical protein
MWDLTVDGAHSFFVGQGAVLVHNCADGIRGPDNYPSNSTPGVRPVEVIPTSQSPFAQEVVREVTETAERSNPWAIHPVVSGVAGAPKWLAIPIGGAVASYVLCRVLGGCDE